MASLYQWKPWGTGQQAVLAAKELIHEPFAVLNVDDYGIYTGRTHSSQARFC